MSKPITAAIMAGTFLFGFGADEARAQTPNNIFQVLTSTGADGDGLATAEWRKIGPSVEFEVEIEDVNQGTYELFVGGLNRGLIQVGAVGEGLIEFENPTDPPAALLDFEVFGQLVEVRQGGTVFFSDIFAPDQAVLSWTVLGDALAGTNGLPALTGEGPQNAGGDATISLANGPASGSAFLVVGFAQLSVPFKGGVLVPSADLIVPGLTLDAAGNTSFDAAVPASLPSGLSLFWQSWIPDAGAPVGFAASNGLESTTL